MAETSSTSTGVAVQQIALNADSGGFTNIDPTVAAYYVKILEDASANAGVAQGLQLQFPIVVDGQVTGWGPTISVAPGYEPVELGEKRSHRSPGPIIGQPPQQTLGMANVGNVIPYCRMRSASASATTINVWEYQ